MKYPVVFVLLLVAVASGAVAREGRDLPVPYGRDFVSVMAVHPPQLPLLQSAPEASAYLQRIEEEQWADGPYGAGLAETLLDAANYLEGRGDTEQANTLLRRAIHVTRINDGLYSTLQLPLLNSLLSNYLSRGDLDSADEIQSWLFRLHRQNNPPSDPEYTAATVAYVDWQHKRWLLNPDPEDPDRLYRIWRLLDRQIPDDDEAPLSAAEHASLAYAQLRLLYVIELADFGLDAESEMMLGRSFPGEQGHANVAKNHMQYLQKIAYSAGRKRLEKLAAQLAADTDIVARAEVERQLADWHLWHGHRSRAAEHYRKSWQLLSADASGELRQRWFGEPIELPADGVLYAGATPPVPGETPVRLEATFRVTAKGKARRIETRALQEGQEGYAFRLTRWLKKGLFRPRLAAGEMVDTEGLRREYQVEL